ELMAVDADHRELRRHLDAELPGGRDRPDGDLVASRNNRGGAPLGVGEQTQGGLVPGGDRVVDPNEVVGVPQASLVECLPEPGEAPIVNVEVRLLVGVVAEV